MNFKPFLASLCLAMAWPASAQGPGGQPAGGHKGGSRPIDGQYIVVFKSDVAQPRELATQLAAETAGEVIHHYGRALKGFATRMSEASAEALRRNPRVAFVEQDATVSLDEVRIDPPTTVPNPTWGLDRIDQRPPAVSGSYAYQYTGIGVHAFIIDTGILATHQEFGGRVLPGFTSISDGRGSTDCNGHGTHVAGTVGGATYGVARAVSLVPVRVLGCTGSGTWSGVIAGIDWAANQTKLRPAVANMSLGGSKSLSLNAAVSGAAADGVTMVVAAGNSGADACSYSPSSEPTAITVGATARGTTSDPRASYSNFGTCVDLFAPGSSITSAWYTGNAATNTISGTSMATPHVAGVAALALAANPQASPRTVAEFVVAQATGGTVSGAGTGSPNRMVYSMAAGAPATATVRTVAISAISGRGVSSGTGWRANATVTVRANEGAGFLDAISGATVTGSFSPGGSASCVTGSTGQCTLTSSRIDRTNRTSQFSVTGVSGVDLLYDKSRNAATTIGIARP